jgi:hypothetical protein
MRLVLGLAAAVAAPISFACVIAHGTESWTGRWATDAASCSALGGAMLYASESALRFADTSCRVGKIYKVGKSVHIQAHCSEGGENRDISVTLTTQQSSDGERLAVTWGNAPIKNMRRCQ